MPQPSILDAAKAMIEEGFTWPSEHRKMREERDQAYFERNVLVAALARLYPSGIAKTDIPGWDPEWHGCVYIDLPTGQISYHYHDREAHLFDGLPPYEGAWDGHDKRTALERIMSLRTHPGAS